jgi:hypothetical protein
MATDFSGCYGQVCEEAVQMLATRLAFLKIRSAAFLKWLDGIVDDYKESVLFDDSVLNEKIEAVSFDKKGNLWYRTKSGKRVTFFVDGHIETVA